MKQGILKSGSRKILCLFLAIVACLLMNIETKAATITGLDVSGLTVTDDGNGITTASGNRIQGSVTSTSSRSTKSAKITITYMGDSAPFSCDYAVTGNYESCSVKKGTTTITTASSGHIEQELSNGDTIVFTFVANKGKVTANIDISNISVMPLGDYNLTLKPVDKASYSINGTSITSETTQQFSNTEQISIQLTSGSDASFIGWYSETQDKIIAFGKKTTFVNDRDQTVYPLFIYEETPVFTVDGKAFFDLNSAIQYTEEQKIKTIVLVKSGSISGDYVLPQDVTLLIPYDDKHTCKTITPSVNTSSYSLGSNYKNLTLCDGTNITVYGKISIGGQIYAGNQETSPGHSAGDYGKLTMTGNSSIVLKSGAGFYSWGYVVGDGVITAESGSEVYEPFEIADFRGGSETSSIGTSTNNRVFPFTQYFVTNITNTLVVEAGAKEYAATAIGAGDAPGTPLPVQLIGETGLFKVNSGSFTKKYNTRTGKMDFTLNGTGEVNSIIMNLVGNSTFAINSASFILPFFEGMKLTIQSGSTLTINSNMEVLPGGEIIVENNSELIISSGKSLYLYDTADWNNSDFRAMPQNHPWSMPSGVNRPNPDSSKDATIDINGIVTVNGGLFTSTAGADIKSTQKTGSLRFTKTPTTQTQIKQAKRVGKTILNWSGLEYPQVNMYAASLHNGSSRASDAPEYTLTKDSAAETTFGYNANKDMWEIPPAEFTVTLDPNGGEGESVTTTIPGGEAYTIPENTFTRDGYRFKEWNTFANGDGTSYEVGSVANFLFDTTLYAIWEQVYTVTWVNDDGTVLASAEYARDENPSEYPGETPTKDPIPEFEYTFVGWSDPETVEGDVIYKALYEATKRSYTITWLDENDDLIDYTEEQYGNVPTHADPEKEPTETESYIFTGWTPSIVAVTGPATYKAQYESEIRTYTITWKLDENTVLRQDTMEFGQTPSYGAIPEKVADAQYTYTFTGWAPEIKEVSGDQEYTAVFDKTINQYTVTWLNDDGTEIKTETVDYGTTAVYSGEVPTKEATAEFSYTFDRWDVEPTVVTSNVTYTATYKEVKNVYNITWKDDQNEILRVTSAEYGTIPTYGTVDEEGKDEVPVKKDDDQYSYKFKEWTPIVEKVTGEATYKAEFEKEVKKYTVEWVDDSGNTLDSKEVEYGSEVPEYTGPTPIKPTDNYFIYSFDGWDNEEITTVEGNITFSPRFSAEPIYYTVTWKDADGTVLETDENVIYGTMPNYDGEVPTKASDDIHRYEFAGWTPEITSVTGNAEYTATYKALSNITITFQAENKNTGGIIGGLNGQVDEVAGAVTAMPTPPSFVGYTFVGWKVEVGSGSEVVSKDVNGNKNKIDVKKINDTMNKLLQANSGSKEVKIIAKYDQKSGQYYTVNLKYNVNGTVYDGVESRHELGNAIKVTAQETYTLDGVEYYFDHWDVEGSVFNSPIVTLNSDSAKTYNAVAYYVEQVVEILPEVQVVGSYPELVEGVAKTAISLAYNVPEGYTYKEVGFVVSTKTSEPTLETGTKSKSTLTKPYGSYTLHVNVNTKRETDIYARAYLVYTNKDGEDVVIYTPVETYNWTSMGGPALS